MNLPDTLHEIAQRLQLDPVQLKMFAAEDTIGGYDANAANRRWPIGSLYGVEGQILYALVRALQPAHVVEIGSLRGCSTTHLATALTINNNGGRLTAVDIAEGTRDLFPKNLESVLTPVVGDGLEWLKRQPDQSIDLIFEDSSHGEDMCAAVSKLALTKLTPGGLLLMHDAAHDFAILEDGRKILTPDGAAIRRGLDRGLGEGQYDVYKTEPSDCGLAIWRRPFGNMPVSLDDGYSYSGLNEVEAQANEQPLKVTPDYLRSGQPLPPGWNLEDGRVYNDEGEVIAQARSLKPVENAKPHPGEPENYVTDSQPMQESNPYEDELKTLTADEVRKLRMNEAMPNPFDKNEGQPTLIDDPDLIAQLTAPIEKPTPKKKPGRKPAAKKAK